jgi:hypothetical protein
MKKMPRKLEITKPPKKTASDKNRTAASASIVSEINDDAGEIKDPQLWRDLVAYWILGMCNNYGYVVMLTAAHDIIKELGGNDSVGH